MCYFLPAHSSADTVSLLGDLFFAAGVPVG